MEYEDYINLKQRIVPQLRFNQAIYEEAVAEYVSAQTIWLDAGCGHHIFPLWRENAERELVTRARLAVGCDVDHKSIAKHRTLKRLVVANLDFLPIRSGSISLLTCNMVVEHLDRPQQVFEEFSRVLRPGGRLIVHTSNTLCHFVLGSRLLPRRARLRLARVLDTRTPDDVFPTRYRANTPARLRRVAAKAGLNQEKCRMLASDATLAVAHPLLAVAELLYIRLTLCSALRALRCSILGTFVKPS